MPNTTVARSTALLCLAAAMGAAPLPAQERSQPRLFLTINAGIVFGGDLWTLPEQPVAIIGGGGFDFDTMHIARRLNPGLAAGLTAALFMSRHFGLTFEAMYLGQHIDDDCTMVAENAALDPQRRNAQVCRSITQKETSVATTGFYLGAMYRFAPGGFATPFLRVQGGVSLRNTSVVETSGAFLDADGTVRDRVIIVDPDDSYTAPTMAISAGVMIPVSPGYQFTLEVRDHIIRMQRVTGPAVAPARHPTEGFYDHAITVTVGFSIVLEKKRGRRY